LAKNHKFFPPPSHLAPSFGVLPSEFMEKLYGSRVFQAAKGENLVILACTVFDYSTRVTDRWTDGRMNGRTKLRRLRCTKAVYLLSRIKSKLSLIDKLHSHKYCMEMEQKTQIVSNK